VPDNLPTGPDNPLSKLEQVAAVMASNGVEYIVIGGQAESLMGSPRVTYDVDLRYLRTPENMGRLAAALRQIGARLRNVPADLPFILDARTLEIGGNFTFHTSVIDLDIVGYVEPIGDYHAVAQGAETYPIAGGPVRTIGLDDLIRVKTTIKRFKDSESMFQLLAIKQVRDEGGRA
jgi:hypothetical protein